MTSLKPFRIIKSELNLCGFLVIFNINAAESPALIALGEVESGNNDYAVGKLGERSRYQIMEATWYMYTKLNFEMYSIKNKVSLEVASAHLVEIAKQFSLETKRIPTQNDLYIMYNCGFGYYKMRNFDYLRCPKTVRERAERFANLCMLYQSKN